jgi:hypothetical protein
MKKFGIKPAIFFLLFLITSSNIHGQNYKEGSIVVNAGIGILSSINYYTGFGVKRTPVLSFTGEYGLMKLGPGILGVGLAFGYQSASYTYDAGIYYYKDRWTTTMFGARATWHPDILNSDKYDVYGIAQLSFDHFGYRFTSNDPYYDRYSYGSSSLSSYVRPYLMVGARYYLSKNFGVFSELGYDISYLKLGLVIKFDAQKK